MVFVCSRVARTRRARYGKKKRQSLTGNLASRRKTLAPVLLRRTRSSVMKDLPQRTTEVVRIKSTGEQLDIHAGQMRVISSIVKKACISEMDLLRLRRALLICRMNADSTFLVDKQRPVGQSDARKRVHGWRRS